MIWNSSQRMYPGSSSGALKPAPFLVLVLKLNNPKVPWRMAALQKIRASPNWMQRGATAQRHIHDTLQEALEICCFLSWVWLAAFIICFLFIGIFHVKVFQANPVEDFYWSHMVKRWKFYRQSNLCWEALWLYLFHILASSHMSAGLLK